MGSSKNVTEEEMKEYENVEIDNDLLNKAKKSGKEKFLNQMYIDSIKNFELLLKKDEKIENYARGRAYKNSQSRILMAFSGPASFVSNPILFNNWASTATIIRTNKSFYILECNKFNKSVKVFEINNSFKLYRGKELSILEVENIEGEKYPIQFSNERIQIFMDVLANKEVQETTDEYKSLVSSMYDSLLYLMIIGLILSIAYFIFTNI